MELFYLKTFSLQNFSGRYKIKQLKKNKIFRLKKKIIFFFNLQILYLNEKFGNFVDTDKKKRFRGIF